jgi:hypothetical protein
VIALGRYVGEHGAGRSVEFYPAKTGNAVLAFYAGRPPGVLTSADQIARWRDENPGGLLIVGGTEAVQRVRGLGGLAVVEAAPQVEDHGQPAVVLFESQGRPEGAPGPADSQDPAGAAPTDQLPQPSGAAPPAAGAGDP